MKILRSNEFSPGPDLIICRESVTAGRIKAMILVAFLTLPIPLFIRAGAPWPVSVLGVLSALLVVPICLKSLSALSADSNWTLAFDGVGLWINLRSYMNLDFPDAPSVVRLEFVEIKYLSICEREYRVPAVDGRASSWVAQSLELQLTGGTDLVVEALIAERRLRSTPKKVLGSTLAGRAVHYPVCVPEPGTIRIAWRENEVGVFISPAAEKAIELFPATVARASTVLKEEADWENAAEVGALIKELAERGNESEAVAIVCKLDSKLGHSEATRVVDVILQRS